MSGAIKPAKLDFKVVEPSVKKNKNDILLLHGISGTKQHFDDIAKDLANKTGRKLYCLDARNHGNSEHSDIFTYSAMSIDVIHFMDEHNVESATILGHSMGGRLAMILALTYPERVESIIVEDMTPKAVPRNIMVAYIELLKLFYNAIDVIPLEADVETANMAIFEHVFTNKPKEVLQNAKMLNKEVYGLPITKKDGKYAWKMNFPNIIKEVESLEMDKNLRGLFRKPALFLYGNLSEFNVGNDEDFILKLFPNAQLHGLPTSHFVHSESPDEYVQAVEKFLNWLSMDSRAIN